MTTVLLLRHAKSDWDAGAAHDRDRPLNKRGRASAALVGRFLRKIDLVPDLVLSSPAVRARTTAEIAAEAGEWAKSGGGGRIELVPRFYESSPPEVVAELARLPKLPPVLLLVGHEPTWSMLASDLIGGGTLRFPTAGLAAIGLPSDSPKSLGEGRGQLLWFVNPRLLEAVGLG